MSWRYICFTFGLRGDWTKREATFKEVWNLVLDILCYFMLFQKYYLALRYICFSFALRGERSKLEAIMSVNLMFSFSFSVKSIFYSFALEERAGWLIGIFRNIFYSCVHLKEYRSGVRENIKRKRSIGGKWHFTAFSANGMSISSSHTKCTSGYELRHSFKTWLDKKAVINQRSLKLGLQIRTVNLP